jgi:signal transduction histidine kinase/CheY-like chemotaxis protein
VFAFLGVLGREHIALPLYGSLPVLIWAAVRFGIGGASVAMTAVAFAAIWSVDRGIGPFLAPSPDENILALQLFIGCTSVPVLFLATLASGRDGALQLYRALLASLEDQVAILDADGVVVAVSESWRRAAAADDAPILHRAQTGTDYSRVCESASATGEASGAELAEGLAAVLAGTRQRFEIESERTSRAGLTETYALTVEKLERTEGGAVIIRRNVTARRQADRELHAQRDQLSHLARVTTVSQLSGALAHELHQPLAAIQTNVEVARRLLRAGATDAGVLNEILEDVVADNRRAVGIIDSLRGLLKKRDVRFEALDLRALIDEVLTLAGTELVARKVAVTTEIAAALPRLYGDRVQLQQLLLNLVLNGSDAIASSPDSKPGSRRIVIAAADTGNGIIHLRVRDNGPGIPAALLPRLFMPFTTTKAQGLGLGLSICHSIVTGHGGQLWAENNADGGATLHCRLPAGDWFSTEGAPSMPSHPITVAIVDDDASIRTSLMRVCTTSGMRATAYASGAEVLTALAEGIEPDCLLVDVHMPEMSGPDLHRELVARGFDIPTVAISADTSLATHPTAQMAGPVMFLPKPISADTLLTTIRRVANPRTTRPISHIAEL